MELIITIKDKNNTKKLQHLRDHLAQSGIPDLESVQFQKGEAKPGEMNNGGTLHGISAVFTSMQGTFIELARALQKWIELAKTDIIIKSPNGGEVTISTAKLDEITIMKLVDNVLHERKQIIVERPSKAIKKK